MPEQGRDGKTKEPSKRKVRYPLHLKRRCMLLLQLRHDRFRDQDDAQVINAVLLGRALKHWPDVKRETLRRRVRELVNEMRHEGAPIASGGGGYWIAKTVDDFERTKAFLRAHGIAELVTNAKIQQSAAHDRAQGQTRLSALHALIAGRSGLDLYAKLGQTPAVTPATPEQGADHSVAAPTTAEQSGQEWSDSLFAFA